MRTRRHFLTATLAAAATLALAGCSTLNAVTGLLGNQINFTQPQLQRYLNQSFPREFDKLGGLVSATLTNPRLSIPSGDNRLRLDFDIGVSALGARDVSRGHFALASRLRYNPATQGLHLDNPEILSVDVPGAGSLMSAFLTPGARRLPSLLEGAMLREAWQLADRQAAAGGNAPSFAQAGAPLGFMELATAIGADLGNAPVNIVNGDFTGVNGNGG